MLHPSRVRRRGSSSYVHGHARYGHPPPTKTKILVSARKPKLICFDSQHRTPASFNPHPKLMPMSIPRHKKQVNSHVNIDFRTKNQSISMPRHNTQANHNLQSTKPNELILHAKLLQLSCFVMVYCYYYRSITTTYTTVHYCITPTAAITVSPFPHSCIYSHSGERTRRSTVTFEALAYLPVAASTAASRRQWRPSSLCAQAPMRVHYYTCRCTDSCRICRWTHKYSELVYVFTLFPQSHCKSVASVAFPKRNHTSSASCALYHIGNLKYLRLQQRTAFVDDAFFVSARWRRTVISFLHLGVTDKPLRCT